MDSNTPKYKDAVGYLLKLRDQKNKPWFSHVCDLAVSTKDDSLSESELNSLWVCFSIKTAYKPTATLPKPPLHVTSALTTPRTLNTLQELSGFNNFKLLSDTLSIKFTKPVSIVFGTVYVNESRSKRMNDLSLYTVRLNLLYGSQLSWHIIFTNIMF